MAGFVRFHCVSCLQCAQTTLFSPLTAVLCSWCAKYCTVNVPERGPASVRPTPGNLITQTHSGSYSQPTSKGSFFSLINRVVKFSLSTLPPPLCYKNKVGGLASLSLRRRAGWRDQVCSKYGHGRFFASAANVKL